jgi:hypothetical protein
MAALSSGGKETVITVVARLAFDCLRVALMTAGRSHYPALECKLQIF